MIERLLALFLTMDPTPSIERPAQRSLRAPGPPTLAEAQKQAKKAAGGRVLFARMVSIPGGEAPLIIANQGPDSDEQKLCDEEGRGRSANAAIAYLFNTSSDPITLGRFPAPNNACCQPFARVTAAPTGTVVLASTCVAFSCGAFCEDGTRLIVLSERDATVAEVRDLTCRKVVSADTRLLADATCSRVRIGRNGIVVTTDRRSGGRRVRERAPITLPPPATEAP